MPKISGWEVLKQLKANPKTRDIPVIILSAKGMVKDAEQSLRLGASTHLSKPFNATQLKDKVMALLPKTQ